MSTTPLPSTSPTSPPPWQEFARAPLVPVAIAATIGLLVERYTSPPMQLWIAATVGSILAWGVAFLRGSRSAGFWLCAAAGGLAGGYLHVHARMLAADDIGHAAGDRYAIARVRGRLVEEPVLRKPVTGALISFPSDPTSTAVIEVSELHTVDGWRPASGKLRLIVEGSMKDLHLGDDIEATGRLARPATASNPGEWDLRQRLQDHRITAELRVEGKTSPPISRLAEGWRYSFYGWLAHLRGRGTQALRESIPEPESGIAAALLLGDGSAMDREEWDAFIRTGVVHVLAISGQHLVVLASFLWLVLRVAGVRRRQGACVVAAFIIGYAILTGGKPSAVRAAVMVSVFCGGMLLRRPVVAANAFALAWLVVIGLDPADPFSAGCLLSFLCVFVLIWFASPMLERPEQDPVKRLIDESRSPWVLLLRSVGRVVGIAYIVSFVLGVANAPLILYWQNLISPAGVVLGPPLILLTSIALIAGFLLLLVGAIAPWLAAPFAWITQLSLAACGAIVHFADQVPGAAIYAPAPSIAWMCGFYSLFCAAILLGKPWRRKAALALLVWSIGGVLLGSRGPASEELRVTFLSVGHGGCVVLEAPDGRVLLYDAGTTLGPDVVRRSVAPFLWHRGIGRIDEVFISHADLDHFNGLTEICRRFSVGKVTLTPSFAEKPSPGVEFVLKELDRRGIERRIATVGDRFTARDVEFEVLHPPPEGPRGIENARSLVLAVRHAGHTILLTGDLEDEGLSMVMAKQAPSVDVMLAPHHGSKDSNTPRFAEWSRPKLVISSQKPGDTKALKKPYEAQGAKFLDTAASGAVTVRSHRTGLVVETFRTNERFVVRYGEGKR